MSMFNESALSKAMKEAYKSGGYNLSIKRVEDSEIKAVINIVAGFWGIRAVVPGAPRSLIGLIAQHVGDIPYDMSLHVSKGIGVQVKMQEEMDGLLETVFGFHPEVDAERLPLTYDDWRLYQREDGKILKYAEDKLAIIDRDFEGSHRIRTTGMMICRDVSGDAVAIMHGEIKDADAYITHLEQRRWW
jgi:hypothetical protein